MKEALKEAKKAFDKNEVPIGCVIVYNDQIIGRGHNQKEEFNLATKHAELIAIEEASKTLSNWYLENCDVYVTLEPCVMCAGGFINSRIRKVYIGARDLRMGALGTNIDLSNLDGFNHKFDVEFGILEDECSGILSEFFKKLRAKKKTKI